MKKLTLVFLVSEDDVLLAMKKRGFGAGRWNGLGGKVSDDETIEEAMIREAKEEAGVIPEKYETAAEITFDELGTERRESHYVEVYLCTKWQGEPAETEEMAPKWFDKKSLPFEQMWDDDRYWLPKILSGQRLKCHFILDDENMVTGKYISDLK